MNARFLLCFLLALGFVSLLGAWSYKQIEPTGNWSWVDLAVMPNGAICIGYQDSISGRIYLTRYDTAWHRDDLG